MSSYDLIIKNGTCAVTAPNGAIKFEKTNLGIKDGRILSLGLASSAAAAQTIDAEHLVVLPGAIDSQVHFRDPGLTHKEDFHSGTLGAVAGGITSVFEMPNTKPNTSTRERLTEKLDNASSKAKCDFAFFAGATHDNIENLQSLAEIPGCCGVKIFMGSSTGDLLVSEDTYLDKIFARVKAPISVHAEDENILKQRKYIAEQGQHPRYHNRWRNTNSALTATRRVVNIARKNGRGVHVLHISSGDEMAFLKQNRDVATVECTPQFLTLSAPECYEIYGTLAQMNPPIREKRHQEALWKAVADGTVDVIGSDHAPHTWAEKSLPYPQSPSGLTGVQTLLPLMLHHANNKKLSLERLVELTSRNPARIFGAKNKGAIAPGFDADFSIVDLKATRTITNSWIKSKCGWTVYDGMSVTGWPKMTIVRGQTAMKEDTIFADIVGQRIQFNR